MLAEDSQGLGLENIKQRYEFLNKHKVEVIEAEGKFVVVIPMIEVV